MRITLQAVTSCSRLPFIASASRRSLVGHILTFSANCSAKITGPPPNIPPIHNTTSASAPLPFPTPLPSFSLPSAQDAKPLYVPGSQAERQARAGRMNRPLRRGTHESWWSAEMGWFNAVAKVGAYHYPARFAMGTYDPTIRQFPHSEYWTKRVIWSRMVMDRRYGCIYIAVLFAWLIPSQATKEEMLSMYVSLYSDDSSFLAFQVSHDDSHTNSRQCPLSVSTPGPYFLLYAMCW